MTVGMFLFFKVGMPALEQMLHEGSLKTVGIPFPYSSSMKDGAVLSGFGCSLGAADMDKRPSEKEQTFSDGLNRIWRMARTSL